ncbi:MAG: ChbG/HpnK family deacetylase [Rhizobiales bacterium]|nr:ChbG/HpnK family deacetylase [Hyphomicrobiales bacterium]
MTAERSRRIWLCADDYGISPGVNRAIRDLLAQGRINATSVMVVAPSFGQSEAKSLATLGADGRRAALGLHVTLTAPFRPLSADYGPCQDGAFLMLGATLRAAFLHRLNRQALVAEVAAQVQAFADALGRTPDFIDGHQHVHLFPQVRDAVLMVARDKAPKAWLRQCGRMSPLRGALSDRKGLFLEFLSFNFRRRARDFGLRTNPAFAGTYDFARRADFAAMFPAFISDLPDDSVVMCHPGFVDEELARLDTLTAPREREYAYFADSRFPEILKSQGVALA